jgi:CPA1 family monovalent cation:H+ antiporter
LLLHFEPAFAWAAVVAIPVVLLARLAAVSLPALVPGLRREFPPKVIVALTWGGLRGGISVALALSLPAGPAKPAILAATYAVVVFSIIVQGLTMKHLVGRFNFAGADKT